ncbi:MAG: hypothetical protein AB7S39_08745 [Gemmatimonadales bacterium]
MPRSVLAPFVSRPDRCRGVASTRRRLALTFLLATAPGCGDSSPTPPEVLQVVIDRPAVDLVVGQTEFRPNARVPNRPNAVITARMAVETRWLTEESVLDPVALADGRVVALGPGSAVVEFSATGADTARLAVTAGYPEPRISRVENGRDVVPGTEVRLRGYRMLTVGNEVQVGGAPATLTRVDSATATFVVPDLGPAPTPAECRSGTPVTLSVAGAVIAPTVAMTRQAARMALAPGAWQRLAPEAAACIRLPALPGRYVLAWVDPTSVVDSGAFAPAGYDRLSASYSVSFAERSETTGAAVPRTAPRPATATADAMAYVAPTATGGSSLIDRASYAVGDTFTVFPDQLAATVPLLVRVYAVYGRVPIIGPESATDVFASRILLQMDRVGPVIDTVLIPLLGRSLGDQRVGTTSGFLPILFVAAQAGPGTASGFTVSLSPTDHVELAVSAGQSFAQVSGVETAFRAIAQPIVSGWIDSFHGFGRQIPRPVAQQWLHDWGHVATRDLLVAEAMRIARGLDFGSNYDWSVSPLTPFWNYPFAELLGGGRISQALSQGGVTYLRHVVHELVAEHAQSYEDALRLIVTGAPFGHYGCYRTACRPAGGLLAVMRRFDPTWDPIDALLEFTLSQGADDRSPDPRFRNPDFAFAGREWSTSAVIRAGSGSTTGFTDVVGGTAGFVLIEDPGVGGVVQTGTTGPLQWALLRLPDGGQSAATWGN